jgi:hypothetical protein
MRRRTSVSVRATVATGALLVASGAAVAAVGTTTETDTPPAKAKLRVVAPAGGEPLSLSNLKPGDVRTSDIVVSNTSKQSSRTALAATAVDDLPGRWGGVLSSRLRLEVDPVGGGARVYEGPLAELGSRALPVLPAGASRTYRLTVTFLDGGTPPSTTTGDNVYQGAATKLKLDWSEVLSAPPLTGGGTTPPPSTGNPGTPGKPAAVPAPPVIRFTSARAHRLGTGGFRVRAWCPAACRVDADVVRPMRRVGSRVLRARVVRRATKLTAPAVVTVRVRPTARQLRSLRRLGRVRVTLRGTVVDAYNRKRTVSRRVLVTRR